MTSGADVVALSPHAGDFYRYETLLRPDEQQRIVALREFLEQEVRPIADDYWDRAEFPRHLIPKVAELGLVGATYEGYQDEPFSRLFNGFVSLEMSRVDPSFGTFWGVHAGLAFASIYHCGSPEQRDRWLPGMVDLTTIGAFGLTEPEHGSDVAGGLETTARAVEGGWVLDGKKRWIGNATFADVVVIWAKDAQSGEVGGFLVERGTEGFVPTKIEGKIALRGVQNADITLTDVFVPADHRLVGATSFADTANVLRITRGGVAWGAVGLQMGAYERALAYTLEREQFGKPLASFQLVQDHLATMLSNVTLSLGMVVRLAQMQDAGIEEEEHAAMAKASAATLMRQTVARAREVMGGNGIVLEHGVARYFADAEAVYSYEGTREVNQLIVGRAVTGIGAFV
ncbi:MAG: acyl-CoA dehydrogenase family protein [Lapillicoccus sp.]